MPAKVNLVLDVRGRRADGYHDVRTVLQAVTLFDRLSFRPAAAVALTCTPPAAGVGADNLAYRAAERLRAAAGVRAGVRIHVSKRIPLQAGLGGGSADAAAALIGCARLWRLDWSRQRLAGVAAALGADVPFFLWGGTAAAAGRGERVTPLPPLPAWPAVLARTGAGSATAAAYAALDALGHWSHPDAAGAVAWVRRLARARGAPEGATLRRPPAAFAALLGNSFHDAVLPERPDVRHLRQTLEEAGALACLLCGSGSAVFALGPGVAWSRSVAAALRRRGVWARAVRFWPRGAEAAPVPAGR